MGDDSFREEGTGPRHGAVDELVRHDDAARRQLGAQAADGADREQELDPDLLQRVDIGAKVDRRRGDAVPAPVTRQKDHRRRPETAAHQLVRRLAEGRLHPYPLDVGDPRQLVQSAAADDP